MTEIKYKEEIARIQRGAKTPKPITFAVDAKRFAPRTEDAPLMFYSDYARFVFTIINKGGNRLRAQIRPQEVPLLTRKYEYCLGKIMDTTSNAQSTSPDAPAVSKASTVKIAMKGAKTVVQLLADGIKVEDLEYTRNILQQNVAKYPRNQDQIDAINEGLEMQKNGTIPAETSNSGVIPIYKSEYRYMTGLDKDTRNNYTLTIDCNVKDGTFNFAIKNQIVKMENGVAGTEAINTMNQYFNCTIQEFDEIIEGMTRTMRWFEMFNCMPQGRLYTTRFNANETQTPANTAEPDFN